MCQDNLEHLHVGYYDNSYNIEATIYQKNNKSIFYLAEEQEIDFNQLKNYKYIKNFGYKILEVNKENLEYDEAYKRFKKFLIDNKLIFK
ncbi:DUF3986 family protein [Macrococcoides bohemicum]|uniref:DUF3986 family protein n=1 Tax=Macrococcoides bohemicum TaxID=1903056 RepID=UPI00165D79A6|nr:DUF3986 family protein [Macrococcus bohemicus]MBC9873918.1 DUF3986 family protein [Macrococcus bohemicus]